MKHIAASRALHLMLGEVLVDIPVPTGGSDMAASIRRNRLIQERLLERATLLAESTWPGFQDLLAALIEKETEFYARAGPHS